MGRNIDWHSIVPTGEGKIADYDRTTVRALTKDEHGKPCVEVDFGQYYIRMAPHVARDLADALLVAAQAIDP